MTRLLTATVACLALTLLTLPAPADWTSPAGPYVEGETTSGGYVYRAGYWYLGDQAYTRTYYPATAGYYYCGYYYPGAAAYFKYTAATAYVAPKLPTLKYTSDWRTEGLRMLTARDDLNAFSNFVHENNLGGGYAIADKYPLAMYGAGAYANVGGYGVSGTTLYAKGGFNALTTALYNTLDASLLNQQADRALARAQQYTAQAHADQSAIVSQVNDGLRQVAVIQALAAGSQPPAVQAQSQFQFNQDGSSQTQTGPVATAQLVMPRATDDAGLTVAGVWATDCASCHSGPKAFKGFTLESYRSLGRQAKIDRVWGRLVSPDPKQLMPRDKPDGTGHRLLDAKLQAFFQDISAMRQ